MIRELSPGDIPDNVTLARSVGWKDVAGDWRVLHAAARVVGVRDAGRLVAQGALADYGTAASLAKMIVAPELQRRGLGRRVMDELLAAPMARGIPIGLCATEFGRPLYEQAGFRVSGEIMILLGTPRLGTTRTDSVVPLASAERAVEIERKFVACDRSGMLRARWAQGEPAFELTANGESGFVLASRFEGGAAVGPLFATSEGGARQLAEAVFQALPGAIRIDVPLQLSAFRAWLVGLGLQEMSPRVEMARGASAMPWQVPQRFALGMQAWG